MPWRFVQCVECKDVRPTIAKKPKCAVGPREARCMQRCIETTVAQCRVCSEWVDLTTQDPYLIPHCLMCGESLGHPARIKSQPKRRTMRRIETP